MAEDEAPKPAEEAPAIATPEASAPALPAETAAQEPAPAPAAPASPPNKLHEWGAAVGIMVFLALVLWVFLNFLRSATL